MSLRTSKKLWVDSEVDTGLGGFFQNPISSALYKFFCDYWHPAYGSSFLRENSERVQKVQTITVLFVFGLRRCDRVSSFRVPASLVTMEAACEILTCGTVRKVLITAEPLYLRDRLQFREKVVLLTSVRISGFIFARTNVKFGESRFCS